VYTQDNLVAGDNIEIKEVVNPNVIDENCILCMHFDNDNKDSSLYSDLSDSTGLTTEYNSTSKFGNASAYVNAGAVYSPKFVEINNEVTIDFWAHTSLNPNASGAQVNIGNFAFAAFGSFSQAQFYLQLNGNSIKWPHNYDVSLIKEGWNHFAGVFLKDENGQIVYRFLVNGKKVLQDASGQYAYFSDYYDLSFMNFAAGYGIDEFRVTKKSVWLDDFIPPTQPYTKGEGGAKKAISAIIHPVELPSDLYRQSNLLGGKDIEIVPEPVEGGIDEYTLSCFHLDESTEDVVTGYIPPNAIIDNTLHKFGTGSTMWVNSTSFPWSLNSYESFSFDFWIYRKSDRSAVLGLGIFRGSPSCHISISSGNNPIQFSVHGIRKDTGVYIDNNTWSHIYVYYNADDRSYHLFLNGKEIYSEVNTTDFSNLRRFESDGFTTSRFDEIRISKCIRWTEDFTPPTQPYRKAEPTGNYVVNFTGEEGSAGGAGASFPLFYHTFADHILNDASWLRGDTFSWQSGDMYVSAYNHLVADYEGDGKQKNTTVYSWAFGEGYSGYNPYTLSEKPSNGSLVFWADIYSIKGILGRVVSFDEETNSFEYEDYKAGTIKIAISPTSEEKLSSFAIDTIGSTEITFYRADDGHKIVLADQESKVSDIYRSTGVAWYYVLDTENKRFKLPRTKHSFAGIRTGVGNFVEAGLPNITGSFVIRGGYVSSASGAIKQSANANSQDNTGNGNVGNNGEIDASLSSEVYGNSDTVQPNATEQYLYFYVGNTVRNQTEVDVGTVTEQLNGKQDVLGNNVDYVVESYNDGTNWYRVYKSGWLEQGGKLTFADATSTNVVFLKPFADTKYTWTQGQMTKNFSQAQFFNGWGLASYSATGFTVYSATNGTNEIAWIAYGQGAI
jgi:hypothetical protein